MRSGTSPLRPLQRPAAGGTRATASFTATRAATAAGRPPGACACGGSCPRCLLPMSRPGDAAEREADRMAANALRRAADPVGVAASMGVDLHSVAIHADAQAAERARAVQARAFAVGPDIFFGAGQYAPETPAGARLLAHELAHVVQQRRAGAPRLQRQSADVVMAQEEIKGALKPVSTGVSGLGALTSPTAAGELSTGRSDDQAPDSTRRLPFTASGWEAGEILTTLGQFDDMPGTDSDANRCVQAVAMASHIVEGPEAVSQYVTAVLLEAALSRPQGARENKAREVLDHFRSRLANRTATYGDVSWAQEALHDLFYGDTVGTPETDIAGLLAKTAGPERTLLAMDVWCDSPADVVAQAKLLRPGEQLLITPVTVTFNQAFDEVAPDPTSREVNERDVVLDNGRQAHVTRFDASTRPPASAIDAARDRASGHQMMIMRDASTGELRVYEPEAVDGGDHFMELDTAGRNFDSAFRDRPADQIYGYVHVIGKISPKTAPPRMFAQYRPSWL